MHFAQVASAFPPVTVFGLPLHPLIVHAVVVLLPLAALGGIVMAAWPKFSRRFGPVVVLLAWAGVAGAVAASHTGEQLQAALGMQIGNHASFGREVKYAAFAFAALLSGLYFLDWRAGRGGKGKKRTALEWVLAVLTIGAALFAIYLTVQAGHTGAKLVWTTIGKYISSK